MIARNRLGRTIAAFYSNVTVRGPHGITSIRAELPDWSSPNEIASMAAAALRERGKEVATVGQLCEALAVAGPAEHEALRGKGLEHVQVLPAAEIVGDNDLGWDDEII